MTSTYARRARKTYKPNARLRQTPPMSATSGSLLAVRGRLRSLRVSLDATVCGADGTAAGAGAGAALAEAGADAVAASWNDAILISGGIVALVWPAAVFASRS